MKSFKKFALLTFFPLLLTASISLLLSKSFKDFEMLIIIFSIGYFSIIALNYIYVFEKLQSKKIETFKNLLLTNISAFLCCFIFGILYQLISISEISLLTATFQGLLAIVIVTLEFSVIKISENSKQQNILIFNEKPWIYILIIFIICLTETLFLILFGIEFLQIEGFHFLEFCFNNFLIRTLSISAVSMLFLYIFSSLKYTRNNLYVLILLTTLITYLSFFAFGYAIFRPTIIVNYLVLAFTSTILSAIIILYKNNRKATKLKIDSLTNSISKKETEYLQLKNQVNPHFLFNNLNTLISFIETEPKKAIEFGHHLSNVYRHYLKNQIEDFISLAEELDFINEYLEIYKAKFESGFTFEIEKKVSNSQYILSLSLQEIIDNIFKHNILDDENPIAIKISIEENDLVIKNTVNLQIEVISNNKGLANINQRNKILMNREISTIKKDTVFEIRIPIIILEK